MCIRDSFCTGRLLEHWHTGTMTRRVPELDRALPEALLNIHPNDASKLGVKDGDLVHVKSRFGEFDIKASTAGRTEPQEGIVFAPFFAEETLVNLAVQDTYCPLSKEPEMCIRDSLSPAGRRRRRSRCSRRP